jgi:hypothetical protein
VPVGVRSVGPRWIAADALPVLVCARPEFDEQLLHPGKCGVVDVASGGVVFVALRVFVGVIEPDECEVFEGAQVERVLPARGVGIGRLSRPEYDVLDEASLDVCVLEDGLSDRPLCVGKGPNSIRPAEVRRYATDRQSSGTETIASRQSPNGSSSGSSRPTRFGRASRPLSRVSGEPRVVRTARAVVVTVPAIGASGSGLTRRWYPLYWPTESLIDIRRDVSAANSINRSVDQYSVAHSMHAGYCDASVGRVAQVGQSAVRRATTNSLSQ